MKRLTAVVLASVMTGAPAAYAQAGGGGGGGDDFSFDIVEEKVTDTDKERVEDAKDLLAQERFGEALAAFDGILQDKKLKKFHPSVQYDMCKAYYKMQAYHASLACFQKILEAGPKHPMYAQTREWLFFIARKIKDELAALRLVARYAKAEDIPAEYQSELGYSLGRYYFLTALELGAKGVAVEQKDDKPVEDKGDTGALDFENVNGKGEGKGKGKKEEKKEDKKDDDGGGFNFDDDALGGGDGDWVVGDKVAQDDLFDMGSSKVKDVKPKKHTRSHRAKKEKEEAKTAEEDKPVTEEKPPETHGFDGPKTADEALKLSLDNLNRVKKDFTLYAQAVYIKGLVHFAKGEFQPAVTEFQNVVRMTNPRTGSVDNPKLREMAFFSLARIHYQFEQFRYAIFYYDRIDRDSEQWLEALFESSWAHFRLGEYQKALGNLVTLQSPFFQDEYYPEAAILKAITFYENCRYPEARAFLGEFEQNYGGVLTELNRLIGDEVIGKDGKVDPKAKKPEPKSAKQMYEELTDLETKVKEGRDDQNRSFALTARLLRLALSDKRVRGYRDAIAEVDDEKQRLAALAQPFNGSQSYQDTNAAVDKRRDELVHQAGSLLQEKLTSERSFLKDLTGKLVRIQFEITKGEKEALEATLTGTTEKTDLFGYRDSTAVDDERLYWPFEGEYWRDELGTYQYTLTKGCKPPEDNTITGN